MNINEVKTQISQMVASFWADKQRPMLLSRLGSIEHAQIAKNVKELGFTLRGFITEQMSDELNLVIHSSKKILIGVFPKKIGSINQAELDLLLEGNSSKTSGIPRFHKTYWAAFKADLKTSQRRFVFISDEPSFLDVDSANPAPAEGIEVERSSLVSSNSSSDEDVYKQMMAWSKSNEIDLDRLKLGFYSKENSKGGSLMESVLGALDSSDLQRISIPLDIVQKLLSTK